LIAGTSLNLHNPWISFDNIGIMNNKELIRGLSALAQESRLAIFKLLLAQGPEGLIAGKIGEELDFAPATLSFHLKELSLAGLVEGRQDGRFIYYTARFDAVNELIACLTENCCGGSGDKSCLAQPATKRVSAAAKRKAA
jgi:DNA-binding transcriptional ArsR family regulator